MSRHNIGLALAKKDNTMSNTDIRVVPGPANYFSHAGSLARLSEFFTPEQLSRAVWIYGERAIEGARPFLPESFNAPGAKRLLFKGHCSERDVTDWSVRPAATPAW